MRKTVTWVATTSACSKIPRGMSAKILQFMPLLLHRRKSMQKPKNKKYNQNWAKEMKKQFSKEDIHMANRHTKKCFASFAIREIQIKTPTAS